jgi:predicted exporter
MRGRGIWILIAGAAVIVAAGLLRLRVDVDVFKLLPSDSRMVGGLQLYQRSFGSSRELVLSVRTPEAERTERAAQSLAQALNASGVTAGVLWQSPFREDPGQLAEFLAYTWFNQPPETFEDMARRFRDQEMKPTLEDTLDRLATSLRPMEVARLAHDPFALTDLSKHVSSPLAQGMEDPFASPEGVFRILFVPVPMETTGFRDLRKWVKEVTALVERWARTQGGDDDSITVRITGTPAFVAKSGAGLLRDVQFAALGTLFLVAGLFWLVHRHWLPLAWLVFLLLLVLAVAISVGALLLGTLNAASLGFAAILLGLAADYGLILYQEFAVHPERSVAEQRTIVAPSILWAAVTTAGAFFMITRSSLPGLTQLGTLVGLGILVAGGVMLVAFLPPVVQRVQPRAETLPRTTGRLSALSSSPRAAWWMTLLAAVASASVLIHRLPSVDYSTRDLGPKENETMEALLEIQREVGGFDDALWLIVHGADASEVADRLETARGELAESVTRGLLAGYRLPNALWPRPDDQQENRNTARWLSSRLADAREAARAAGFTEESLLLTEQIFAAWERFAGTQGVVSPTNPASQWVFRQFAGEDSGRLLALGQLEAAANTTQTELLRLTQRIAESTGAVMFSWSLLSESLLGIMERDVRRVLFPMAAVLLILLGMAFRNLGEVALSLATLGFSLLCLMGVMALLGWSWNLMNVMALPLLFGAGVDYSIHIQFAMKRYGGDLVRVRRTVGRAILLCGVSTASGFGTLGLASNAGLASLGRVCSAGIVLTSLISVFLLPAWWRSVRRKERNESSPEVP